MKLWHKPLFFSDYGHWICVFQGPLAQPPQPWEWINLLPDGHAFRPHPYIRRLEKHPQIVNILNYAVSEQLLKICEAIDTHQQITVFVLEREEKVKQGGEILHQCHKRRKNSEQQISPRQLGVNFIRPQTGNHHQSGGNWSTRLR